MLIGAAACMKAGEALSPTLAVTWIVVATMTLLAEWMCWVYITARLGALSTPVMVVYTLAISCLQVGSVLLLAATEHGMTTETFVWCMGVMVTSMVHMSYRCRVRKPTPLETPPLSV